MSLPVQALAAGALGPALLHIERGDTDLAQRVIAEATADGVSVGANASLFHGAPALEFVLGAAKCMDAKLQAAVDAVVSRRLVAAYDRQAVGRRPTLGEFDLVGGLTGLGVVLLSRGRPTSLLDEVLTYLVGLATPACLDGTTLPGWWTDTGPSGEALDGGHSNHGMAHGIAGPLALLATAMRQGVEVGGQAEAIQTLTEWLERFGSAYWIIRDQLVGHELLPAGTSRPSWCYGAAGIARALQLAAIALGDRGRRQQAEHLAHAALSAPSVSRTIVDASLCHGWAGLLQVTKAVAEDSAEPALFRGLVQELARRTRLGLDALPDTGLMEGKAGAELSLLDSSVTGWARLMLLS